MHPKRIPHLPMVQARRGDLGYLPCIEVPSTLDEGIINWGGREGSGVEREKPNISHRKRILPLTHHRASHENVHLTNTTFTGGQHWVSLPISRIYWMAKKLEGRISIEWKVVYKEERQGWYWSTVTSFTVIGH